VSAVLSFEAALREGITDARGLGLGGWTLGVHHFYDPATRVLHLGSGERRRAESVARVIDRVPIPVLPDNSGAGIAFGPDKSLYTIHYGGGGSTDTVVRRLFPDGTQVIVAGGGNQGTPPHGEDGPAVGAAIFSPNAPAIGPDGSLYLMDGSRVILRVGPDGIIRRVAGMTRFSNVGTPCPSGTPLPEGIVATETDLCMDSYTLAVAPDGSIYFIERVGNFERVKRIGPDGLITTVAGNGPACPTSGSDQCGDGGPALAARFSSGNHFLALGPDGSVYVNDRFAVRRIAPDGIIERFAGQLRQNGIFGDGGLAVDALLCGAPRMAVGPDGALYLLDLQRIRRVIGGIITAVAGSGTSCGGSPSHTGDGGPALQATIDNSLGLAVAPDDEIFVGSFGTNSVLRRIGEPLPGFTDTDILVASEDGRLLYGFDPNGRHLHTFDALTGALRREFGYDAEGRLATVTEKTGGTDNVTTIERNAQGNPTGIVGPFGKRTTLTTDANGFLASVTNPVGETTTLASTASGLLTSFTRPGNRTSAFTYDAAGRLLLDEDAADGSQSLARTGLPAAFTVTRSTALGRGTTYQVESLPDRTQRRTVTAPDGTQGTSVENLDAATRQTTSPDGTQMTIVAGGDPRFGVAVPVATSVSVRLPGGLTASATNARAATLANPFDPLSLLQLTESSTVGGRTAITTYTAATRTFLTTTPLGRTRTLVLDALGRPASLQASGGVATTTEFDARGRLTTVTTGSGPDARQFGFTYDAQGLPATLTDPVGRSVSLERDAVGRVVRKILPGGDEIQLAYDAAGDLAGVTPPGRPAYAFTYGPRHELLSVTPPAVPGSGATTFAYDDDGALTSIARPGEIVAIGYDAAGRLDALDLAVQGGPQGAYAVTYDDTTGAVTQVTGPGGATLDYEHEGAVLTGITWGGPVTGSVAITLDDRLAVATESVNGETPIPFVHDDDDHLVGAGDLTITRDATTGLPAATALGVVADTWVHDAFGELVDYEVTANGTPIYAEAFTYDALGRVVQKVESIGGSTDTLSYEYDPKGQLVTVRRDGVVVESYAYDANGNRVGGTSHDDQDRLLASGSTTFAYTSSGRLATRTTPGGTTSFTYDAAGNLLAVALPDGTDVTYALDPAFRRVARDVDGVPAERFLWTGDRPIAQLDAGGTLVSRFVYAGGTAPAYLVRGGVAHRLITDQTGSVRLVVNTASGAVVQRLDYDAFGRVTLDTNPGFQPFGFAGGLYDPATGLVRFGARDYDAATGRWTVPDPLGFAALDTNLYRYAGNDPVNLVDPRGLGTAGDIAAAVVAGLADVFFFATAVPQAAANLNALALNALGYPTPAPPDMNPVVSFLDAVNGVADTFFDAEPVVDTSSTAFGVTRFCAGLLGSLGANAAGNAARGAGAAGKAGNAIRPAMRPAVKNVSRTSDPNYRPAVEALTKRAERLAAEEQAQAASALQKAKEAAGRWLESLGSEGRANPANDSFKPLGGA
jgi:RHS repeat-associated protein